MLTPTCLRFSALFCVLLPFALLGCADNPAQTPRDEGGKDSAATVDGSRASLDGGTDGASLTEPTPPELQPVEHCVGERAPCETFATRSGCEAEGCAWSSCTGVGTDCWEATGAGTDLRLCEELDAYCQVADTFIGRACQADSPAGSHVPCSAFDAIVGGRYDCQQSGCTWNDAPVCSGSVTSCELLEPDACRSAEGCRVIEQREAPCTGIFCACAQGSTRCDLACIDTESSELHCGACNAACGAGSQCVQGSCVDLDECTLGEATCPEHASCRNLERGYTCDCLPGFAGEGCTDVNECAANTHGCAEHAACTNTVGSFVCACESAYEGDGKTCTNIDDCANSPCGEHGACTDETGFYMCECDAGYGWPGDGACVLVDGCVAAGLSCDALATCTLGTDGTYACICHDGYEGTGETCADIDECAAGAQCGENRVCENSEGSHGCPCAPGRAEDSAGNCAITNLCLAEQGCALDPRCVSTATQYVCECGEGEASSCGDWVPVEWRSVSSDTWTGTGYWFVAPRAMRVLAARSQNFQRPADPGTITPKYAGAKRYYFYSIPRNPSTSPERMTDVTLLGACNATDEEPCFPDLAIAAGTRVGVIAAHFDPNTDGWVGLRSNDTNGNFVIGDTLVTPRPLQWDLGPTRSGAELVEGLEVYPNVSVSLGAVGVMWRAE